MGPLGIKAQFSGFKRDFSAIIARRRREASLCHYIQKSPASYHMNSG
jgi:hypothetical protein